ncbi:hypothetical protein PG996_012863 [Apiospora saccharicola]|uniref:Uncharacterized protein n=1 Tax=Apiospora saccharicola TaxID=335842 RepID=A0ABR1U3T6_9PEZI
MRVPHWSRLGNTDPNTQVQTFETTRHNHDTAHGICGMISEELRGAEASLRSTGAAALVAAKLARAASILAALLASNSRHRSGSGCRLGLTGLGGAAAHGAEVTGLDAGAAQRVAADQPRGALGLAALLELVHAAGLAVLHLAREARLAEDGRACQHRLRRLRRLGDALGLAIDHLAPVLAPDVGAAEAAAATTAGESIVVAVAAEDGVRDSAEGGGEEEEGFHDGGHCGYN